METPAREHWIIENKIDENGNSFEQWSPVPGSPAEDFIEHLTNIAENAEFVDYVPRPRRTKGEE